MQNQNTQQFDKLINKYRTQKPAMLQGIAVVAYNFFIAGFRLQGQQLTGAVKKWKPRKFNTDRSRSNRAVLTKTGNLKQSLYKSISVGISQISIGTTTPYAQLHNDGGKIPVTTAMRRFFWAMYNTENAKKNKKLAQTWRNLALTKKTHFDIPARPFLYDSVDLVKKIDQYILKKLDKI